MELRIDDKAFTRLIRKWLKAGILEPDGVVNYPEKGSPQGGIVSPILANIYLHYALDVWFEETVKAHSRWAVYLCRYADDFVCAFELEVDAERFYGVLGERLDKFGLEVAAEKTNLLNLRNKTAYGNGYHIYRRWGGLVIGLLAAAIDRSHSDSFRETMSEQKVPITAHLRNSIEKKLHRFILVSA